MEYKNATNMVYEIFTDMSGFEEEIAEMIEMDEFEMKIVKRKSRVVDEKKRRDDKSYRHFRARKKAARKSKNRIRHDYMEKERMEEEQTAEYMHMHTSEKIHNAVKAAKFRRCRMEEEQTVAYMHTKEKHNTVKEGLKFYYEDLEDAELENYDSSESLSISDRIMLLEDEMRNNEEDIQYLQAKIERYQSEIDFLMMLNECNKEEIEKYKAVLI